MSWFPWVQATVVQPTFVCKHCGEVMPREGDTIIACSCEGALTEQQGERQIRINFQREQEAARNKAGR